MARLIFDKVIVSNAGGSTNASDISGIVTDSISMAEELIQVAIEDNQNVTEGFTSTMSFRTRDTTYSGGARSGNTIIETGYGPALVYAGGSNALAKRKIEFMHASGSGPNLAIDGVYLMGRRVFENGREEVEVSCQIDSTTTKITAS